MSIDSKWLLVIALVGCRPNPSRVENPTPGKIIVVDEQGNHSEFVPLTEDEFRKLQNDLKQRQAIDTRRLDKTP